MPTPVFALCDRYINDLCSLDPVRATYWGVAGDFPAGTDYGPDGIAARAALTRDILARLRTVPPTGPADQLAATHLRERLEADLAGHEAGEPLRALAAPYGMLHSVRHSVDLMPRTSAEQWRAVSRRIAAVPGMLASWRDALAAGAGRGLVAARRQAVEAAAQAQKYADGRTFAPLEAELAAAGGAGLAPGAVAELSRALAMAATAAYAGFAETADWLRREYVPVAAEADGVGPQRYALASRQWLGEVIDPYEAYEWGWEELRGLERELATEAGRIRPGAALDEVIAQLDATESLVGIDAYQGWLRERHDQAIDALHGVHFDIPEPLRSVDVVVVVDSPAGSAFYTPPSEDLRRSGRTWWPAAARERFGVWSELTTVYHEGVPGHHLQLGQTRVMGEQLSRFSKLTGVSGHGEGWALYAERLADELGWYEQAVGTRLGMLKASAMRAARVVIDIGLHLDLPLPEPEARRHGPRWNFDTALAVLRERGRIAAHRARPEVVRYCGWPGQATAYKLGERAWLAARAEAQARLGADFDLKRWHTEALSLGPVGLATLAGTLRSVGSR